MKHPISETFLSIEGEAKYSGKPTAYIRYAGCNMKCAGFNNPDDDIQPDGYATLPFDIIKLKSLDDVPEISVGCDSQYAVNPKFKHIWDHHTADELAQRVVDMLPEKRWIYPNTQQRVSLSLTGGEPTLRWKIIPELLNHELMRDMNHIIFETNCSVPLKDKFIDSIGEWLAGDSSRVWTWSNSPKLAVSGEPRDKAIKPTIAVAQMDKLRSTGQVEQYFKFVCDDSDECFAEVDDVMKEYHEGGVPLDVPVYIMPMCCTESQQIQIMQAVADKCIQKGFIYCHRIHNTVYENAIGK